MKVFLNTTKTMDLSAAAPIGLKLSQPHFQDTAAQLMKSVQRLSLPKLTRQMALSAKLADETKAAVVQWGQTGEPLAPALFAFTGLVYKYIDPFSWTAPQVRDAQKRIVILSGLYGLLQPLDEIAAYRLEMGSKFKPPRAPHLVSYWQKKLTTELNSRLKENEPILNLAAQEYTKALDLKALKGPLISPVFKETRPDGSLKNVSVHAKMARGSMVKYVFVSGAKKPADLLGFGELGWEATCEPPASGPWLFTRPARD